jgi:Protein of unknown function (DUF2924)
MRWQGSTSAKWPNRRAIDRGEQSNGGNMVLRRVRADSRPLPGTRLVREWQGVRHVVTFHPDHFEFRHVAGTRWNGWIFFGCAWRDAARPAASRAAGRS